MCSSVPFAFLRFALLQVICLYGLAMEFFFFLYILLLSYALGYSFDIVLLSIISMQFFRELGNKWCFFFFFFFSLTFFSAIYLFMLGVLCVCGRGNYTRLVRMYGLCR